MKVNILDAHDRLLWYHKQANYISKGCEDCIKNRPPEFKNHPFYIWAHARTADDGVTKRLLWMPRLTKPPVETNSLLFKYYPSSDTIKIIWMIPAREMWGQYIQGNVTESQIVSESINKFRHHKKSLSVKESDDLEDSQIDSIYKEIATNKLNSKPKILEESSIPLV